MPDYSNDLSRKTEQRIGPFKYKNEEIKEGVIGAVINKGPYELDNGAIYSGQWT
jgi:hypothetical protein